MISFVETGEKDLVFFNEVKNINSNHSRKFSLEETKRWFINNGNKHYTMYNDDTKIGFIGTNNYSMDDKSVFFEIILHKDFKNSEIYFDAINHFIPFIKKTLGIKTLNTILMSDDDLIKIYNILLFEEIDRKVYYGDLYTLTLSLNI